MARTLGPNFWILAGLIALCALGGGSSRADVPSLLFVRPAAVLAIAAFLARPGRWDVHVAKGPALCLIALAALMLVQLIPLPPSLWTALPGHGRFAAAADLIGAPQSWLPVSLTPDLGWSSLFDLLVPAAILIGYARLSGAERLRLLDVLIVLVGFAAALGVLQISTGVGYLYRLTSPGLPVGPFANRNHQATLLAVALPALRVWSALPPPGTWAARWRTMATSALVLVVVVLVMLDGSRAGLLLLVLMALIAGLIAGLPRFAEHRRGHTLAVTAGVGGVLVLTGLLTVAMGRSLTVNRLLEGDVMADQRAQAGPVVWRIMRDFAPWGSGFGSFDRVFRIYEPDTLLNGGFFNHAHNDATELALTGGMAAVVILIAFLAWWGRHALAAIRSRPAGQEREATLLARTGAAVTLGIGLASLVDYPLRTPLMAAIFVLACAWQGSAQVSRRHEPRGPAANFT